MVSLSMFCQILNVFAVYAKKSWGVKLQELLICLLFLSPAVDAYRISTKYADEELGIDPLNEMVCNKCVELAFESIPGCVLQLYAWLAYPDQAGTYALVSIGISALTTGFTSAMIAFDKDVDVVGRRAQPKFYGYIPDDNGLRGRCFALMTIISSLHNVSRSLSVALLAASGNKMLVVYFVGGEVALFFMFKCIRGDIWYWTPATGVLTYIVAFFGRIVGKVIADFSGCLHFRYAYEMGGIALSVSMMWAQIMPFVALQFYEGGNKDALTTILVCSFALWLLLNFDFFCTIDLSYLNMFFGTMTAPQYACELF